MTDTTDTPIRRAGSAIGEMLATARVSGRKDLTVDEIARAALTAALKVRWYGDIGYIGPFEVGRTVNLPTLDKWQAWRSDDIAIGHFTSQTDAKTAVERAVIEAILGEKSE